MKDEKLIKILALDPDRGVRIMTDEYSGIIFSVIRKHLSSSVFCEADIEDCVAETLSDAYFGLKNFDISRGSLKTWLCTIAERNAKDALRRYYRSSGAIPLEEAADVTDVNAEDEAVSKAEKEALVSALKKLSAAEREIVVRKYYLSQPSKQIAAEMHLSVSNVDTKTHRAIAKLRKILEDQQ